ncbi:MAG TPA: queuosine salvage family protein [Solirubrobacteraceae bacterium]|nr:queuosine salvage family protein [Solirubrobacteraceae bacterium]
MATTTLSDTVRAHAAEVAATARWVTIELDRAGDVPPGPAPELDPVRHFLEGTRDEVAAYLLTLTAINFGSGWFPTLRKRVVDGAPASGYFTVAIGLTERFRTVGPWTNAELRAMRTEEIAEVLGQRPGHELMALYAQALRQLGAFLGDRTPLQLVLRAGSAQRLAAEVARMPMWNDAGFYKRAQILASDLALAGVAELPDLDTLTIFADNLVPHVLRCDGVLRYDDALARRVDAGELLTDAAMEREIRACAVHACVHLADRLGVPERVLDGWLWNRGQEPEYKARPRHRTRTVFY